MPDARERLLGVISFTECANDGTTPDALLAGYRDQVLAEGADLIHTHRGGLDDDAPWWDTRDRDTAAALLLAARTQER